MAAPVGQYSVQVHQQTHTDSSSPTFSERAASLVEGFNCSDISPEDAQTHAQLLMEEIFIGLNEPSPNLEEAREVFAKFLFLHVEFIPMVAVNTLSRLLAPETLTYDLANTQANALLTLERTLSEAIEQHLLKGSKKKFLLKLLNLYEDILEHLWLLPYLYNDPEIHTIIIQQGVPPLLNRSEKMMGLLGKVLHVSSRFQNKHRSIEMAYMRLATPLDHRYIEEIQLITPQSNDPFFLGMLAGLYQLMQDYYRAIYYYEKALALADSLEGKGFNLKELIGTLCENLGIAHRSLSNYAKAIEYHEKHVEIAQTLGDREGEGAAYNGLGIAHRFLSNYAKAIEYHKKGLAIARSLRDRSGEGTAYGNLGIAHQFLNDYAKAIEYHEKTLEIAQALGDQATEGLAYGNLGNAHESLANYAKAIEYHKKDLAIAQALGDRAGEGMAYGNLGNAQFSLGKTTWSIKCHERALAIAQIMRDRTGKGRVYRNLGIVLRSFSDYTKAIEYHEKHLAITQALGDRAGEGRAYGSLGVVYQSLGGYADATEYHEKALAMAQTLGERSGKGVAYGNLGPAHQSLGNSPLAIECFEKNLEIAQELDESDSIAASHNNFGRIYFELEDYAKAEEHYQEGVRTFSHIQHSLGKMYHSKITIFEEQARTYFGLEETFLIQNRHRDALVVSDSRRSRTLIDRIQAKLGLPVDSLDAPMQIEEMQDLAEKLGTTFVVFRFSLFEKADRAFGVWIIHPEQEIVYRSIKAPIIHNAIRSGGITPFQDRGTLEKNRGRDGLDSLFAILPTPDLVTEVEKEQIAFLQDWYDELIAPILDDLPTEDDARITLVPDGPLMDLPFALLMDPEEAYLFEKYTISITPSIKSLHLLTQREIFPSEKNLIVGNPTAPDMPSLPSATTEARKVAAVTGTPVKDIFLEGEALKTTVLSMLEGSRFIHLACHGFPKAKDKHSIYDGAFYLTPDEEDPKGILYAEEIVACDLNAELVLLSACHSGKGRQQQEGVIGPIRSFLAAGAQTVVATLWTLPDSELTIDMVSKFYEHILGTSEIAIAKCRPLDKDEALREVMRIAASGLARNRPQEWGAFFMTGALQPCPQNAGIPTV